MFATVTTANAPLFKTAPALVAPSGTVVNVATTAQLQAAVENLQSNTTILLAPGVYNLTERLYIHDVSNVVVRGATGNRNDVILNGRGMYNANFGGVPDAIMLANAHDALIADLTIRNVWNHCIALNAGTERPVLRNLHLVNAGEQFIKANPDDLGGGVDGGIVEYSRIEYTTTAKDFYTNGVDIHSGAGWIIRHNVFRNIRAPEGELAGPAVLVWRGSRDTITEGNLFLNVQRAIHYGMNDGPAPDHEGGIIRNNFIHRSGSQTGDVGIAIVNAPDTQIVHNTVVLSGTYDNAIEYRFAGSQGLQIHNNLTDASIVGRDGAGAARSGNLTTAQAEWFVNAAAGNLHLRPTSPAVDAAAALHANADYDRQLRPSGSAPDIGADEYVASTTLNAAPVLSLSGTLGYVLGDPPVVLAGGATVTDADSLNFAGGRLRVRIVQGIDASNRLAIGGAFTVSGTSIYLGTAKIGRIDSDGVGTNDLLIAFTVNATPTIVQQLVRSITFSAVSNSATRSIRFYVTDGDGGVSATRAKTVAIVSA